MNYREYIFNSRIIYAKAALSMKNSRNFPNPSL
jgi:hypothetical protein